MWVMATGVTLTMSSSSSSRACPSWSAAVSTVRFHLDPGTGAVRRRNGGRWRRWVVLYDQRWRRAAHFLSAAAAASDRTREHWNRALAGQAFFFWFYRGQPLHLWSPMGRWRRRVYCEYALCAQFHSRKELIVHCLIFGGSYKCNVECWGDADSAGVENTALENEELKNMGIKIRLALNG